MLAQRIVSRRPYLQCASWLPIVQAQLPRLPGGLTIARPPNQALATQSAVFGLLAMWTLAQVGRAVQVAPIVDSMASLLGSASDVQLRSSVTHA